MEQHKLAEAIRALPTPGSANTKALLAPQVPTAGHPALTRGREQRSARLLGTPQENHSWGRRWLSAFQAKAVISRSSLRRRTRCCRAAEARRPARRLHLGVIAPAVCLLLGLGVYSALKDKGAGRHTRIWGRSAEGSCF